jgi:hypothetical protein
VNQALEIPWGFISNELKSIIPLGKNLFEVSSVSGYTTGPQQLQITPGIFENIVNNGLIYDTLLQKATLSGFSSYNTVSYSITGKHWTLIPEAGFKYTNQLFTSDLFILKEGNQVIADSLFQNHLKWQNVKVFTKIALLYKLGDLIAGLSIPVNYNRYKLYDPIAYKGQQIKRLTIDPEFNINYELSSFWKMRIGFSYDHDFGDINQVHYDFFMKSYSSLVRRDAPLPESSSQHYTVSAKYKNPVKSFFASMSYHFSAINHSLLWQNDVLPDGAIIYSAIEDENSGWQHDLSIRTSKFIPDIKTTVKFESLINQGKREMMLNQRKTSLQNKFFSFEPGLSSHLTNWLDIEYKSSFNIFLTKTDHEEQARNSQQVYTLNLAFYPAKNQYLGLTTAYYSNELPGNKTNNFFTDLVYRYTLEKKKTDLEIRGNNIFNHSEYNNTTLNAYQIINSRYILRPAQILFSVRFSF